MMDDVIATMHTAHQQRLRRRHRRAGVFKMTGWLAVVVIVGIFLVILGSIISRALPILWVEEVFVPLAASSALHPHDPHHHDAAHMGSLLRLPPEAKSLVTRRAWWYAASAEPGSQGVWMPLRFGVEPTTQLQKNWLAAHKKKATWRRVFNAGFFQHADALAPESAGILGALQGTLYVLALAFLVAVPMGIIVAVYLQEFTSEDNPIIRLITVNINNLAAVPSIIFGLLGLALWVNFFGVPRSSGVVGGLTLGLMMLPLIIVSARLALAQVPKTLKEAALGLGASQHQAVFHHVVPAAMPGIITGTLLALARMIGESAPLLMVGMVVFMAQPPGDIAAPTTVLPVLIYQWFQRPEPGFIQASSAAIIVLLAVLWSLNTVALFVRKKFEKYR